MDAFVDVEVYVVLDVDEFAWCPMADEELQLAHERLDVYRLAIEFLALATKLTEGLPVSNTLADQLRRASLSVPLNIAEGAGKPNGSADAKRSYNIARGSAMECGAILDAFRVMKRIEDQDFKNGKRMLVRIVSMLTRM